MQHKEYKSFVKRLSTLKERVLPQKLLGLIKKEKLISIVDYVLNTPHLTALIKTLRPNESIRLKKEGHGLSRTVSILVAPNKQIHCMVETKSKDKDDRKRDLGADKIEGSTNKRGKPCWRLDAEQGPLEHLSMIIALEPKSMVEKYEAIKGEVAFPWQVKNPSLHRSVLGPFYSHKEQLQQSIYTLRGIPLDVAIRNGIAGKKLTQAECDSISVQLLAGLNLLHKKGIVLQDIKPANIILFKEKGRIKARFIDFDLIAKEHSADNVAASTIGYESPEIALTHSRKSSKLEKYYAQGTSLGKKYSTSANQGIQQTIRYLKPDPANDVWALGITLFELYHFGKQPADLPKKWVFSGMLAPKREDRLSAGEAYKIALEQQALVKSRLKRLRKR